jgi:hypothetical protein
VFLDIVPMFVCTRLPCDGALESGIAQRPKQLSENPAVQTRGKIQIDPIPNRGVQLRISPDLTRNRERSKLAPGCGDLRRCGGALPMPQILGPSWLMCSGAARVLGFLSQTIVKPLQIDITLKMVRFVQVLPLGEHLFLLELIQALALADTRLDCSRGYGILSRSRSIMG